MINVAIEWAVRAQPFIQYDGTNSAEICAAFTQLLPENPAAAVVREEDGSVTIELSTPDFGPWLNYTLAEGERIGVLTGYQPAHTEWSTQFMRVA